ncbi:MAG: DUF5615 family PIN-like protein [Candidatus Bipolaricaulia bacterium]
MGGRPDQAVAERCRAEGLVLTTPDVGFSDTGAYPPSEFPGVIVHRLRQQDRATIAKVVSRLIRILEEEELHDQVWNVDESRIRVRD